MTKEQKLAEYEDLEKRGMLIKLPVELDSTVYIIHDGKVHEDICDDYDIWSIRDGIALRLTLKFFRNYVVGAIGENIFLDSKDAKKKLEEMG